MEFMFQQNPREGITVELDFIFNRKCHKFGHALDGGGGVKLSGIAHSVFFFVKFNLMYKPDNDICTTARAPLAATKEQAASCQ